MTCQAPRGFSLVEVLVALGIFALLAATVLTLALSAFFVDQRVERASQALGLAAEGLEAVRSIRQADFSELTSGNHGLSTTSGFWTLTVAPQAIGPYTRTIALGDVFRTNGGQGEIVSAGSAGAVLDLSSKRVTSTVTWLSATGVTSQVSAVTLVTNWRGAVLEWRQDTLADFSAGYRDSVQLASVGNGEVRLAAAGDWSAAATVKTIDLPGNKDARDCVFDGINEVLYVLTKPQGAGKPEFYGYDTADITATTTALFSRLTVDVGEAGSALSVNGPYAYIATGKNDQELIAVRLSDGAVLPPWNTPNSAEDANDVVATGTVAYLVTDRSGSQPELFAVDVTNPAAMPAQPLGSAEISAHVNAVTLSSDGAYIFLATDDNAGELVVVRRSDLAIVQRLDVGGNGDATDVTTAGSILYVTKRKDSGGEVYALDAANPAAIPATPLASVELNEHATHLALHGPRVFVTTESGNGELAVFTANPLTLVGTVDLTGDEAGVGVCAAGAYAYVVSKSNTSEVLVAAGSSGGSGFAPSGAFTSQSFDSGADSAVWQTLQWVASGGGGLTFRLRTADTAAGLSTARWVGPDGTPATAYGASGAAVTLDPLAAGRRWIQFRAYLATGAPGSTPSLESVSLTYRR